MIFLTFAPFREMRLLQYSLLVSQTVSMRPQVMVPDVKPKSKKSRSTRHKKAEVAKIAKDHPSPDKCVEHCTSWLGRLSKQLSVSSPDCIVKCINDSPSVETGAKEEACLASGYSFVKPLDRCFVNKTAPSCNAECRRSIVEVCEARNRTLKPKNKATYANEWKLAGSITPDGHPTCMTTKLFQSGLSQARDCKARGLDYVWQPSENRCDLIIPSAQIDECSQLVRDERKFDLEHFCESKCPSDHVWLQGAW